MNSRLLIIAVVAYIAFYLAISNHYKIQKLEKDIKLCFGEVEDNLWSIEEKINYSKKPVAKKKAVINKKVKK